VTLIIIVISININVIINECVIIGQIVGLLVMLLLCRSTPCPSVKHGDEWGDPSQCDNADECTYCHTRTEQQFHPEVCQVTAIIMSLQSV